MAEKLSLKSILNSERIREKGVVRFVLEIGVIRFALPVTLLSKIIFYLLEYGWTITNVEEIFTAENVYYFFAQILFEGIIFGFIIWHWGKQEDYPKLNQ